MERMIDTTTVRHALVLGGTSGLGRASAAALLAAGSHVTITGRDPARTAAAAAELGAELRSERGAETRGAVSGLALDLADAASVAALCAAAPGLGISQLVLNSGGPKPSTALQLAAADARSALEFLLFAQLEIVGAVLPGMLDAGWGRIVAIGSSGVQQPIPNLALSNMGRAALAAYLKSLAGDVAARGVTVNMVLPGRIATDRVATMDAAVAENSGRSVDAVRAASQARIPLGRYGRAEELGGAVAFLCSPGASYITGEQLRVDGGLVGSY
jgi:3-oxoacyl-[acyl-carrier protein] reductase